MSVCPSVRLFNRPSVCLSQAGTVPKCLNAGSRKKRQGTLFSDAKDVGEIPTESLPTGAPNKGEVG